MDQENAHRRSLARGTANDSGAGRILAGTEAAVNEVLLWTPHLHDGDVLHADLEPADNAIPASRRWNFQHLKASQKYGCQLEYDGLLSMAAVRDGAAFVSTTSAAYSHSPGLERFCSSRP